MPNAGGLFFQGEKGSMKIAIVGSTGYIASYLVDQLQKQKEITSILKIDRSNTEHKLELLRADEFDYDLLNDVEYVIFTAAVSGPDQCASDFQTCWRINVEGTCTFIENALSRNCNVLFFSSDAVFGDDCGKAFNEESPTCAITPYGKMKKAVEEKFKEKSGFKAIRLSYVVSTHDKFIKYCLECIENNSKAEIFHPFYRNCITLSEVAEIVIWMLHQWENYPHTFLNAAGLELISRIRLVDELNRHVGKEPRYTITIPDEIFFKNRPRITQMESKYLQTYRILKPKSFTERFEAELKGAIL
jgi:dTDP-4-dehydrorhamnose reductase